MTLAVTGDTERARTLFLEALGTAETLGDDNLREQAILAAYTGLVSPDDVGLIATLASEARQRAVSSPRLKWTAAHFDLTSAVIRGQRDRVDESLSDLRDALLVSPEPVREYGLAYTEAAVLHLDGDLDAAERQLERAFDLGVKAYPAGWVRAIDRTILLAIRFDQGRAGELAGMFAIRDRTGGGVPSHRAASSYIALVSGDRATAVEELARAAAAGFESLPRDHLWTMGMYFYSLIASELEDNSAASELHRLFAPYSGRMTWSGVVSFGPVDDALGRLAVTRGRRTEAADYLQAARELCVRMRAPKMQDRVESAIA